ncbi:hypothetical protein RYH80_08570 [Halobaculum sp. MBLA0147]|uniref:hypothetical protein n=1 Tax=Halobaculum sp. MBLA0147 TaxID=3079934 RepID=UPI0035249192
MPPSLLFESVVTAPVAAVLIVSVALIVLLVTSGVVVNAALGLAGVDPETPRADSSEGGDDSEATQRRVDTGRVIGKVENVLVVTLTLVGGYTALGVIFAGKSFVRVEDMDGNDSSYYLTGTITNFVYSLVVGVVTRGALRLLI